MQTQHCLTLARLCVGAAFTACIALAAMGSWAEEKSARQAPPPGARQGPSHSLAESPAPAEVDVILGRVADRRVTFSVLSRGKPRTLILQIDAADGKAAPTAPIALEVQADQPREWEATGLKPDQAYRYTLSDRQLGQAVVEGQFHTQRAVGKTFSFTLTADSHLDEQTDVALLERTLDQALEADGDFHIDLGDTFMTDKYASFEASRPQYLAQRAWMARLAHRRPLVLVLGNHDGESAKERRGPSPSVADQAQALRQRLFPNPKPDGFYQSSETPSAAPSRQDHAAWVWGDALFITLTPYWESSRGRQQEGWGLSLGRAQYDWLARTLAASTQRHKFIFIHQLVGGQGRGGRGGIEAVRFGEWGGQHADGSPGFTEQRPGWPEPIHPMLVRHGVTAVFHGHDHLYARQVLDGISYQTVPQPGHPDAPLAAQAQQLREYGYLSGDLHAKSGHLRVTVSPTGVDWVFVPNQAAAGASPGSSPTKSLPAVAKPEPDRGASTALAQGRRRGTGRAEPPKPAEVIAQQALSVVLGRPTDRSISLNLLANRDLEVGVEIRPEQPGAPGPWRTSGRANLKAHTPHSLSLQGLAAHAAYLYRLSWKPAGSVEAPQTQEWGRFQLQRRPGEAFRFEIQGDSHPERSHQFDADLYARTLIGAAQAQPDFYFLLGDDFSVDTLRELTPETVAGRYALQRPYLGLVGRVAPTFLVNGNHEQASAANHDGTPDNVAVWAQNARNRYFDQPAPDGFYSGNPHPIAHIGLPRNYYAWTWGDALFVVIDPYWHSLSVVDNALGTRDKATAAPAASQGSIEAERSARASDEAAAKRPRRPGSASGKNGGRDLWSITLGEAQYRWLAGTLEGSTARYKFVFAHHVLGTGRGGASQAPYYEWGGLNRQGLREFEQRRPGWPHTIHELFVRHGVSAFFQGHDHVFAREEKDGVVYQTCPEPADASGTLYFEQAYRGALLHSNSGRVRVDVGPAEAVVSYVRPGPSGEAEVTRYTIKPRETGPRTGSN